MRLQLLLEGLTDDAPASEIDVTGVTHDSRRAGPGDLFVAVRGARFDGRRFAADAVRGGAVAAIGEGAAPEGFPAPWISVDQPRRLLGPLAARVYGHPERELVLVGVTGTNGKTSVVHLVASVLEAAGSPAGRLGTLGYGFADSSQTLERTTPEASDLFRLLRRMRDAGARAAALEVSSHALALERVEGLSFDVAVFTNLSRDHLDFHRDLEEYYAAKRSLFARLKPHGRGVVNVGDRFGRRLAGELPEALTYGPGGQVSVRSHELSWRGTRAVVDTPAGPLELTSALLGAFNLSNVCAAVAAGVALELPLEAVGRGVAAVGSVPGRLQPVDRGQSFAVLVDYAHTPAALAAAVAAVRELTGGRLVLVFGCGGERDRGKRAPMGRAAGAAELPILTSDNPRGEDPLAIIAEVEVGLRESGNRDYRIVPDRREAIRRAIAVAGPDDAVLIAGKGHESVQIVAGEAVPFSDVEEAARALEESVG